MGYIPYLRRKYKRTALLILIIDPLPNLDFVLAFSFSNFRQVVESGIPILTKNIPEVGEMRIRYPIMPIHDHGNSVYKELSALTDMTLKKHKYLNLYPDLKQVDNVTVEEVCVALELLHTCQHMSLIITPHRFSFTFTNCCSLPSR